MRCLFLLPLLFFTRPSLTGGFLRPKFIDPTGTYILRGDIKRNNITGHYGEMRVRLLNKETVAFCFYINNGYPDYASGAILDTLDYTDNKMHFRPRHDTTCSLVLSFTVQNVEIMEVYSDPRSGCGFAPGIMAPATFHKISSDIPVIQDLSQRDGTGG